MKTQRCRGFQGEITPSAAKDFDLVFHDLFVWLLVAALRGSYFVASSLNCYINE